MQKRIILFLLFSLLVIFAVRSLDKNSSRAKLVGEEFRDVSLAMQNHIACFGSLPPAITWSSADPPTALASWRLRVSTFLEGFSYPPANHRSEWNSEDNSALHNIPTSLALSFRFSDNENNFARVYAVTGRDTAFGNSTSDATNWLPENLPPHTIVAIEVAESNKHWMEPGDYHVNTIRNEMLMENGQFRSGYCPGRFHVIFADFQVWALRTSTPFDNIKRFLTITSASKHDRNEHLQPYRLATFNIVDDD